MTRMSPGSKVRSFKPRSTERRSSGASSSNIRPVSPPATSSDGAGAAAAAAGPMAGTKRSSIRSSTRSSRASSGIERNSSPGVGSRRGRRAGGASGCSPGTRIFGLVSSSGRPGRGPGTVSVKSRGGGAATGSASAVPAARAAPGSVAAGIVASLSATTGSTATGSGAMGAGSGDGLRLLARWSGGLVAVGAEQPSEHPQDAAPGLGSPAAGAREGSRGRGGPG